MSYEFRERIEKTISILVAVIIVSLLFYTLGGTESRVPEIQRRAPAEITERGFNILRYEGYQRGAWSNHGGKVWYQVEEKNNPNIRYRIYVTLWNHEIMFTYGEAEPISNLQVVHDEFKR